MRGAWYEVGKTDQDYAQATGAIASGDLLELEVSDKTGTPQGVVIAEVVGQTLDKKSGLPLTHTTPMATNLGIIRDRMYHNLTSPNAIHLCKGPVAGVNIPVDDRHVQLVERWRIRSRASITEDWAAIVHEARKEVEELLVLRPLRGNDQSLPIGVEYIVSLLPNTDVLLEVPRRIAPMSTTTGATLLARPRLANGDLLRKELGNAVPHRLGARWSASLRWPKWRTCGAAWMRRLSGHPLSGLAELASGVKHRLWIRPVAVGTSSRRFLRRTSHRLSARLVAKLVKATNLLAVLEKSPMVVRSLDLGRRSAARPFLLDLLAHLAWPSRLRVRSSRTRTMRRRAKSLISSRSASASRLATVAYTR